MQRHMKLKLIAVIALVLSTAASGSNKCASVANSCIDVFDTGSGKLFTNSPSVAYLDGIGGSPTHPTHPTWTVDGTRGPSGTFYLFNWSNAKALCNTYNSQSLGGRTNWRLPTREELMGLYDSYGNMFSARGWPTDGTYWSVTADDAYYYDVDLGYGYVSTSEPNSTSDNPNLFPSYTTYASCVSNP